MKLRLEQKKLFPMVCLNEKENNVGINSNFKKIGYVFIYLLILKMKTLVHRLEFLKQFL
jgi:hypothetical protein